MSIENGISGPTAYACAALGAIMGDVFHSHRDGYRFSRLACDLVEKYGFIEYQARVYLAMSSSPRIGLSRSGVRSNSTA